MSRSNPNEHLTNPSERWFEFSGKYGDIPSYNREEKKKERFPLPFTVMLLDETITASGFSSLHGGIYSNQVRDTSREPFLVKSKKSGNIAEGPWMLIKDSVKSAGGKYTKNLYCAYKDDATDSYKLGCLQLKGSALFAYNEFKKLVANERYTKALCIESTTKEQNGAVTYHVPKFALRAVTPAADAAAIALDKQLQAYLAATMKKNADDAADEAAAHVDDEVAAASVQEDTSDIPF